MGTIQIPGPGSVQGVAPARDPGVRGSPDDFGAQIGGAVADAGNVLASIGTHLNARRQQAEDDIYVQRATMEANHDAYRSYLDRENSGEAVQGPDHFYGLVDGDVNKIATEVPNRLQTEGGYRPSKPAQARVQGMFTELRSKYGIQALTAGNNARIGKLSTDLETSLTEVQTGAAEHGDFGAAQKAVGSMLDTARTFLPPDEVEKLKGRTNAEMGRSVISYLDKLQDDGLHATTDEERETYVVQAEGLIDQAGANGWMAPNDVASNKRVWAQNYAKRVAGSLEPLERLKALGGGAATGSFVDKVIGAESGGDPNADNPNSTATGPGQFIESTWAQFIDARHPELAAQGEDIQKFRNDKTLSREAVGWLAEQNGEALTSAGLPVTDGSLYLAHFAGSDGAVDLLGADPTASAESVLGSKVVNANPFLKGKTAADVIAWADKKMGSAPGTPSPFFENLPVDVRTQLVAGARAAMARGQGEYISKVDDYAAFLRAGNEPDGRYSQEELQTTLGPERGAEVYQELQDSAGYGKDVATVSMASPEELATIVAQRQALLSSPENFKQSAQNLAGLNAIIKSRDTQIAADPGTYVLRDPRVANAYQGLTTSYNDPQADPAARQAASSDFAAASLGAQSVLGVPPDKQRILPEALAQGIVSQFKSQPEGGQNAAQLMQSLEAQWGKYWPQVYGEMAKDLPGTALVVGAMNRPGQERAADKLAQASIVGTKGLEDALPNDTVKPIRDGMAAVMEPFANTLVHSAGATKTYLAFQEGVYQLALSYAREGDAAGALDRAYQDVLGKAYTMEDTYRVPIEHDAEAIKNGADNVLKGLDGVNMALPTSLAGLDSEQTRAAYLDAVKAHGFWVNSPDESGLTLFDGQQPVLTTAGAPVAMTWQQVLDLSGSAASVAPIGRGGR